MGQKLRNQLWKITWSSAWILLYLVMWRHVARVRNKNNVNSYKRVRIEFYAAAKRAIFLGGGRDFLFHPKLLSPCMQFACSRSSRRTNKLDWITIRHNRRMRTHKEQTIMAVSAAFDITRCNRRHRAWCVASIIRRKIHRVTLQFGRLVWRYVV